MKEFLKKELYSFRAVAAILARWLLLAVPTGLVCGAVGTAFHLAVEHVTEWRAEHIWLPCMLPESRTAAAVSCSAVLSLSDCFGDNGIAMIRISTAVSAIAIQSLFLSCRSLFIQDIQLFFR